MRSVVKWVLRGIGAVIFLGVAALVVGATIEWQAARRDAKNFPPPGRLVEVGDLTLHLDCVGEGGPTIVVDVGAGNWSTHWKHIQEKLGRNGRVCLHDRPGFGWSDSSSERRTGAGFAHQLHELLAAAGEEPPYVMVGHSLGGFVVRLYNDSRPADVAGVVLVESGHEDQFSKMPYMTNIIGGAERQMKLAAMMARFGAFRFLEMPNTKPDLPNPGQQETVDAMMKTAKHWKAMAKTFPSGVWIADELAGKGRLGDKPLLVISAGRSAYTYCEYLGFDCDRVQREWDDLQASLIDLSTNAEQLIHPTATHDINIDDPEFLVERIGAFRESLRN